MAGYTIKGEKKRKRKRLKRIIQNMLQREKQMKKEGETYRRNEPGDNGYLKN